MIENINNKFELRENWGYLQKVKACKRTTGQFFGDRKHRETLLSNNRKTITWWLLNNLVSSVGVMGLGESNNNTIVSIESYWGWNTQKQLGLQ